MPPFTPISETESVFSEASVQIQRLRELLHARSQNIFELGAVLSEIKKVYEKDELEFTFEGLKIYQFQFFGQFCEDLGLFKTTADRAVRLHRKFIEDLGLGLEYVSGFNYTKLDVICEVCDDSNYPYWLQLCEDMKYVDLRKLRSEFRTTGELPGLTSSGDPISTAILPDTARDWIDSFFSLHESVKTIFVAPQDKAFIKEVYEEQWGLFEELLRRKARGTEHKKASDKLLKVMESIVKRPSSLK